MSEILVLLGTAGDAFASSAPLVVGIGFCAAIIIEPQKVPESEEYRESALRNPGNNVAAFFSPLHRA